MKIKKKSIWRDKHNNKIRVSRLRKDEVCFYPIAGGGAEQRLPRTAFLDRFELV